MDDCINFIIESSIPDLRTASFNINHKSSGGRKYQNAMVLEYNGNTYRYEGQVDHRHNAKGLKNSGKLVSMEFINRNWLVNIHQNCNLGRFTP
jgi:hypothetical protein